MVSWLTRVDQSETVAERLIFFQKFKKLFVDKSETVVDQSETVVDQSEMDVDQSEPVVEP